VVEPVWGASPGRFRGYAGVTTLCKPPLPADLPKGWLHKKDVPLPARIQTNGACQTRQDLNWRPKNPVQKRTGWCGLPPWSPRWCEALQSRTGRVRLPCGFAEGPRDPCDPRVSINPLRLELSRSRPRDPRSSKAAAMATAASPRLWRSMQPQSAPGARERARHP